MGKRDRGRRAALPPLRPQALQHRGHRFLGKMGQVVGFAEVRQDHMLKAVVEDVAQKNGGLRVGQMPGLAPHPLLQRGRIGPVAEQLRVVVGFKHQAVTTAQPVLHQLGDHPGIGAVPHEQAAIVQEEADRVCRVMGDGKGMDLKILKHEGLARNKGLAVREVIQDRPGRGQGRFIDKDRQAKAAGEDRRSLDMVAVLMGDEDGGEGFRLNPDPGQPPLDLLAGKTGIDEQPGFPGLDKGRVALAAAP